MAPEMEAFASSTPTNASKKLDAEFDQLVEVDHAEGNFNHGTLKGQVFPVLIDASKVCCRQFGLGQSDT